MGIYDRDYQRGNIYRRNDIFGMGGGTTLTTKIVIVMFAVYAVQWVTRGPFPDDGWFTDTFSLHADLGKKPWDIFQLLTYGFLHHPWDFRHILFNMFTFWFFGRAIEYRYGQREYLAFFLISIIVAGFVWMMSVVVANHQWMSNTTSLGASGGISAVLLLYCFNYPHQMIYIWAILPIPAWVFAIVFVGMDILGSTGRPIDGNKDVAYAAHLGGALFAVLYYKAGWRLERFLPGPALLERLRPKPKLRVLDPEAPEQSTEDQVDEILKKIQEHGRDSLTRAERRILEEASQQYQKKRR